MAILIYKGLTYTFPIIIYPGYIDHLDYRLLKSFKN